MSPEVGISAVGAYIPRRRLQRAAVADALAWFNADLAGWRNGERAAASWDEDAITMAVEAARDCLHDADRSTVRKLMLASTTHPYVDRQNAGVVKEALNLADGVGTLDIGGSQRAGTSALLAAIEGAAVAGPTLCLAAERPRARAGSEGEVTSGDAAAAFLVGGTDPLAIYLGSHSVTIDFVDHVRASGHAHDFTWEARWVRDEGYLKIAVESIRSALDTLDLDAGAIDHFIVAPHRRGVDVAVAAAVGVRPAAVADPMSDTLGNPGCAQSLIMLATVLERAAPGDLILVVGFGQGCDVIAFRASEGVAKPRRAMGVGGWLARRKPDSNYLKHLHFAGELDLEVGMRGAIEINTPLSMLYRERKSLLGLVAGRCRETGAVQFPRSAVPADASHRSRGTMDDYPLADRPGRVLTFTADRLATSPEPPNCYGVVEFDVGGRLMTDFCDVDDDGMQVGDAVRMMFRIKKREPSRGFDHYFWKAVPDYRLAVGG